MPIGDFVKKNKVFTFFTTVFLVWIITLIILIFTAQRDVVFYDALSQTDVSSEYSSTIPLLRYLVEPFSGIAFMIKDSYTWILAFLGIMVIYRFIYIILRKRGLFNTEKGKLIWYPIKDIIGFSFKVIGLFLLIGLSILGIGYLVIGFHFINNTFMDLLQIGIPVSFILILIKVIVILYKGFNPNLCLGYMNKKRKQPLERQSRVKKVSRIARREISYILGIGLLLAGSNILLIATHFPTQKIETSLAADEFLFDFHVHTSSSDGFLTPEERVLWYMEQGIDGAAFSDHDNLEGAIAAKAFVEANNLDFIVLVAEEWTDHDDDTGFHMNIFGLDEAIVPLESETPEWFDGPKAMNVSDTIAYVKANGGYVTVNHYNTGNNPNGGIGNPYNLTDFVKWGIDGFEIVNGGSYQGRYETIRDFCIAQNISCMGGSDSHENSELNTVVKLRLADPTDLTLANIFETLKNNTHEVIAIRFNPREINLGDLIDDLGLGIIENFAEYLINLEAFQILSWIIWSCAGYLIMVLFYRKVKRSDIEKLRKNIL